MGTPGSLCSKEEFQSYRIMRSKLARFIHISCESGFVALILGPRELADNLKYEMKNQLAKLGHSHYKQFMNYPFSRMTLEMEIQCG